LTEARRLDERRQAALTRYYCDVRGWHCRRRPHHAVRHSRSHRPITPAGSSSRSGRRAALVARRRVVDCGVCGLTEQAVAEAELAASLDYDAVLLSLAAFREQDNERVLDHCRRVSDVIPVMGFYLQPAVGGRMLDRAFWREFHRDRRVVAIKVAPSIAIERSTSPRPWPRAAAAMSLSIRGTTTRLSWIC
jgi:hypothetical protein